MSYSETPTIDAVLLPFDAGTCTLISPATEQLPFVARALMSPAILRPVVRRQSQSHLPIISRPLVADRPIGRPEQAKATLIDLSFERPSKS